MDYLIKTRKEILNLDTIYQVDAFSFLLPLYCYIAKGKISLKGFDEFKKDVDDKIEKEELCGKCLYDALRCFSDSEHGYFQLYLACAYKPHIIRELMGIRFPARIKYLKEKIQGHGTLPRYSILRVDPECDQKMATRSCAQEKMLKTPYMTGTVFQGSDAMILKLLSLDLEFNSRSPEYPDPVANIEDIRLDMSYKITKCPDSFIDDKIAFIKYLDSFSHRYNCSFDYTFLPALDAKLQAATSVTPVATKQPQQMEGESQAKIENQMDELVADATTKLSLKEATPEQPQQTESVESMEVTTSQSTKI